MLQEVVATHEAVALGVPDPHRVEPVALETFDGAGVYRTTENGATIDTSGDLHGATFQNSAELGKVVRNDPAVPECVVNRAFAYGTGKVAHWQTLMPIKEDFAERGYRFVDLLRAVALSDAFLNAKTEAAQLAAHH